MRKIFCILALTTTLYAQPNFVALDKELRGLMAQEKTATPSQLAKIKAREAVILAEFNAPNQARADTDDAASKAAWKTKKAQEHKDFCTAHPQEKVCK